VSPEQVIRNAARPLLRMLVQPLEKEDLYQVGRIAIWQAGPDKPPSHQTVIARKAMIDELRRHRWIKRAAYGTAPMDMQSYDDWGTVPDGSTDCHAASLVAVRQCIAGFGRLTERQRDVLGALASGMHQAEVARTLGISEKRVSQLVADLRAVVARYV
jgi:RNA polymerase sigma factor (sigma-70 family)